MPFDTVGCYVLLLIHIIIIIYTHTLISTQLQLLFLFTTNGISSGTNPFKRVEHLRITINTHIVL